MSFGNLFSPPFKADWPDDKRLVKPVHLQAWANWVRESKELFVDYETNGNNIRKGARPFIVGCYDNEKGPKVLDFRFMGADADNAHQAVKDSLTKRTGVTTAFNIAFEQRMTRAQYGANMGGTPRDPMLEAYAINERRITYGEFGPFSQKALIHYELGLEPVYAAAVSSWLNTNFGGKEAGWDCIPASLIVPYSCEDLETGARLAACTRAQVERLGLAELVDTDAHCTDEVGRMEDRGLCFDVEKAKGLANAYSEQFKQAYGELTGALGRPFDYASHQKTFGLLYGEFSIPMHKDLEKYGKVDKTTLAWMLSLDIPPKQKKVIECLLRCRELTKLKDTYLMPWVYEWQVDGVLHPNLRMMGTDTRRFSADNPNLQNVPARTELGAALRECFVSRYGFRTYSMDLSQAEYRAFAHYARSSLLISKWRLDPSFDIHQLVSEMMKVPRKTGKNLNFGTLYGMGEDKLARELGVSNEVARALLARYHALLPEIKRHRKELENQVRLHGFVRDVFGGRRHLTVKEAHKALNTECQMTVGDMMRLAMKRAGAIIRAAGGHMLLQVHDELLFELPGENVEEHKPTLRHVKSEAMERMPISAPMLSSCEVFTPDWNNAVGVEL